VIFLDCPHGRLSARSCEDCALVSSLEAGQQPSPPSKTSDPARVSVDVDTLLDVGAGRSVFVAAGDAIPLGLEGKERRPARAKPKRKT
jgi:hypothetical protein